MNHSEQFILVAEDDAKIAQLLIDYLQLNGFSSHYVADGRDAVHIVQTRSPKALILDLMLPDMTGLEVCRAIRRFSAVPIIMATARVDEVDRLIGLESGADDYICKPFSLREILARLRALIRRTEGHVTKTREDTGFFVEESAQRISWGNIFLPLTRVEYRLFRMFLTQPDRLFSREALLNALHDQFHDVCDRTIDSHIKNLRRKLSQCIPGREFIYSVYGVGYRFKM